MSILEAWKEDIFASQKKARSPQMKLSFCAGKYHAGVLRAYWD
jgi:hypothetical protein